MAGKYEGSGLTDHTAAHTKVLLKDGSWGTFDQRRKEREAMKELEDYNEELRRTQKPLKREAPPPEKPGILGKIKNKMVKEGTDAARRVGHIKDMAVRNLDAKGAYARGREIDKKYEEE